MKEKNRYVPMLNYMSEQMDKYGEDVDSLQYIQTIVRLIDARDPRLTPGAIELISRFSVKETFPKVE